MKLSWFSPLPPAHTEIGNVTGRMLPALASAFDLTVYTEAPAWDPDLDRHCPITTFASETIDWKTLNLSGLPVYHIGNNIHFHGEIIKVARRCPGIVVLHDLALHETILNLCLRKGSGRAGYFDILHKYGGEPAVRAGRAFLDEGAGDTNQLSVEYPLFEYVLENAVGVITHNPLNAGLVRKVSGAPVLYAPLPFLDRGRMAPPVVRAPRESEPYHILIFGFLGSDNRRLHPFLKALSECAASGRFTVTLAGKYDERKVKSWIQDLGLSSRATLRGFVSDGELDALLAASDLVPNLRWPSRGESSATLLRIWNFSLPSLVTETAFYATLPGDSVAFVDPESEEADIRRHLEAFAADPRPYFAMGRAGREHLAAEHSADAFTGYLESFLPEVMEWRGRMYPQLFGRALARNFLADYPVPSSRPALIEACAKEIATWA